MAERTIENIIGDNIREIRKKHELTVEQVAFMLDLTPSYVGMIERGIRCTTIKRLIKFAKLFEVTLDDLAADKDVIKSFEYFECEDNEFVIKLNKIRIQLHNLDMNKLEFISKMIEAVRCIDVYE